MPDSQMPSFQPKPSKRWSVMFHWRQSFHRLPFVRITFCNVIRTSNESMFKKVRIRQNLRHGGYVPENKSRKLFIILTLSYISVFIYSTFILSQRFKLFL